MATISQAGYNALPQSMRSSYRSAGNGSYTSDPNPSTPISYLAPNGAKSNSYVTQPGAAQPNPGMLNVASSGYGGDGYGGGATSRAMSGLTGSFGGAHMLDQPNPNVPQQPSYLWGETADYNKSQTQQQMLQDQEKLLSQQYGLNQTRDSRAGEAFRITQDLIGKLQNGFNTYSSQGNGGANYIPQNINFNPGSYTSVGSPLIAPEAALDTASTNFQNAALGKAKANAGAMGKSAVDALRSQLAERGILGGGSEARGLTDRLAAATNPISDVNNQALHENVGIAQHNQDLQQGANNLSYQGALTQRGQDIGAGEAASQQALQAAIARGQLSQQANTLYSQNRIQALDAALNNLSRLY